MTSILYSSHPLISRANGTHSQQGSLAAASQSITGGYEGNSNALRITIAFLLGLSLYNAVELTLLVFATFVRFHGTYFYSLLISTLGVLPYSTGFILKFFKVTEGNSKWLAVTLITIGWYAMVTGQSVVLWSRLHLILVGGTADRILKWTKWMIIANVFILHVPTTILTYGCNGSLDTLGFVKAFQVYEKIQMVGFCLQELLLSSIYIIHTLRILRSSQAIHKPSPHHTSLSHASASTDKPRKSSLANSKSSATITKILYQLFTINVLIIAMDVLLLGFEFANLYIMEASFKGVVYSVKLKLEFAVLGKLVLLVKRERTVSTAALNGGGPGKHKAGYGDGGDLEVKDVSGFGESNGHVNGNASGNVGGNGQAVNSTRRGTGTARTGDDRPSMPPLPEMQSDSPAQRGTAVSAIDSMEMPSARRTTAPKAAKGNQDAVFEHYEQVLDREGSL